MSQLFFRGFVMQTTVTIDDQQLKNLMLHTHSENESEAIYKAVRASATDKQQQYLLALCGQVEIADNWQALRELEINK